jgi:hypothetical protein
MAISDLYALGRLAERMPLPLIAGHCREILAGPVRLVVESRDRVPDSAELHHTLPGTSDDVEALDDGGASLHVFDAATGLEHLRFDCFEKQPHYHYVNHEDGTNRIVRIDEHAVGDPVSWTIACLRDHLAAMLRFAGAGSLADEVESVPDELASAVSELERVLETSRAAVLSARVLRLSSK